jgi:hypothetical protein
MINSDRVVLNHLTAFSWRVYPGPFACAQLSGMSSPSLFGVGSFKVIGTRSKIR